MLDGLERKPIPENFPVKHGAGRDPFSGQKIANENDLYVSEKEPLPFEKYEKKFQRGRIVKILILSLLTFLLSVTFIYAAYFLWKGYSVSKKMNAGITEEKQNFLQEARSIISPLIPTGESKALQGEAEGRINILLMGAAGKNKPGGNLTDTIILMSIDTKNSKVSLLSLPRDLYVNIPGTQSFSKINSLYQLGLNANEDVNFIKSAVEKITATRIDYYVALDFDGFKKIINDIGGVNVMVERDLYDPRYPGPNYSYETFSISKGFHSLDGETALKYVRERHSDPEGDFGRAKRQQQVIQAVKNKLFSAQTFFNALRLNDALNTLGENIRTNIKFEDIEKFLILSKKLDLQNISNVVVDAWKPDSPLKVSHVTLGNSRAFILVPRVGNYSEIQDLAKNIFNQDEIEKRKKTIAAEKASVAIINKSGNAGLAEKIHRLLTEKMKIRSVISTSKSSLYNPSQTIVIDNTQGEKIFTLDELVTKLPAKLTNGSRQTNNQNYDIIVELGTDLIETYKYEEDSIEDFNRAQDDQNNFQF